MKTTIRQSIIILVLSTALGFTYNAFSPKGIPLVRTAPTKIAVDDAALFAPPATQPVDTTAPSAAGQPQRDTVAEEVEAPVIAPLHERALKNPDSMAALAKVKDEEYRILTLEQTKRLLEEKRGIFLDARTPAEYAAGHIAGAINISYLEVENYFEQLVQIPQDTLIVVYCSNPECHLGRGLMRFISQMDYHNIYLYDDGWDGWKAAGMPFEKAESGQ